eukprot:jgi/Mesvir1/5555/Mv15582-RA.1
MAAEQDGPYKATDEAWRSFRVNKISEEVPLPFVAESNRLAVLRSQIAVLSRRYLHLGDPKAKQDAALVAAVVDRLLKICEFAGALANSVFESATRRYEELQKVDPAKAGKAPVFQPARKFVAAELSRYLSNSKYKANSGKRGIRNPDEGGALANLTNLDTPKVKVGVPKPKMAKTKQDKTHLEPQAPAKLSRVATIRKDAQPKIGMFIAVRFLLEDPKKDRDEWIWEFGKVCSINKKRKIPHSILFVEHDGASKTYELALNDLPQDENSKEICAWVALDGVYPEDMTAYRVLKRSQAAVKAAASVDPTNMQDPVKKRQVEESAQQVPVKRAKGVVAGAAVQGSEAKAGTKEVRTEVVDPSYRRCLLDIMNVSLNFMKMHQIPDQLAKHR